MSCRRGACSLFAAKGCVPRGDHSGHGAPVAGPEKERRIAPSQVWRLAAVPAADQNRKRRAAKEGLQGKVFVVARYCRVIPRMGLHATAIACGARKPGSRYRLSMRSCIGMRPAVLSGRLLSSTSSARLGMRRPFWITLTNLQRSIPSLPSHYKQKLHPAQRWVGVAASAPGSMLR
jgi:hypothetical protein